MLNFSPDKVVNYPFPYVISESVFDEDVYQRLKEEMPSCDEIMAIQSGRDRPFRYDFSTKDPEFFQYLKTSSCWHELYRYLYSAGLIELTLVCFDQAMRQFEFRGNLEI